MTVVRESALSLESRTAPETRQTALIRAAQTGDELAFERLVQCYDQGVLRLAFNLLRCSEDAADVYQETFLRVYRNIHTFRFDCSFQTWLYRIVSNLCLDMLRKRKSRKEESTVLDTADGIHDRAEVIPEERAEANPQRRLLSGELQRRIEAVLSNLSPANAWCSKCGTTRECG